MGVMELTVDLILSALLMVSIGLSVYLARALARLRRDRVELSNLIESLNVSSTQAHQGIDHLRQTADLVGRQLGKTVEQARALRGELADLSERADRVAGRLEQGLQPTRFVPATATDLPTAPRALSVPGPALSSDHAIGKSAAERDLIRALRMRQG